MSRPFAEAVEVHVDEFGIVLNEVGRDSWLLSIITYSYSALPAVGTSLAG